MTSDNLSPEPADMSPELTVLANLALEAAYAYWQGYQQELGREAVIWLRDDETGHLLIFTRGEYASRLLAAVPDRDAPFSIY